jgi:HD-like signal output (HDOD) protein
MAALSKLPPFSPILNKLMASLAGEDVSFSKLGDLIEKDTVVAGNILHLVNSALYARHGTINSVRHALSILGVDKVRNTVLAMSVSRMLNHANTPAGWSMARFNLHSAAAAILSDQLAQHVPTVYPEGAFVAGLLHDVGRLLIAIGLPAEFGRVLQHYEHSGLSWTECEQELLGFTHAQLSADALAIWEVPEPIQVAVRDHHTPPSFRAGQPAALSCVLNAANQYINSIGESILVQQKSDGSGSTCIQSLGLPPETMEQMLADFQAEHKAMAQYFH